MEKNTETEMESWVHIHSRKLAWKPKKGPIKTIVPLKQGYMGFHVRLGECRGLIYLPLVSREGRNGRQDRSYYVVRARGLGFRV